MSARVVEIFTSSVRGAPLLSVPEARLEAGKGLIGDRYVIGAGTFSPSLHGKPDVEITLIELEEIRRFNESQPSPSAPGEFRRNIVTSGVRLNDLVGRRFSVGGAVLEGIRLCEPCTHLAKLMNPAVLEGMEHRAGLRARVVESAVIRPGDPIVLDQPA